MQCMSSYFCGLVLRENCINFSECYYEVGVVSGKHEALGNTALLFMECVCVLSSCCSTILRLSNLFLLAYGEYYVSGAGIAL